MKKSKNIIDKHIGPGIFNLDGWNYICEKYNGRLPVRIKAVKEGSVIPINNVLLTIESTDDNCPWLPQFLETLLTHIWYPTTVATLSYYTKLLLKEYLLKTSDKVGDDFNNILNFQLHDFGCRGVESMEAAEVGGSAHLLNFNGTDTVPALLFPNKYYNSDSSEEMFGFSVKATEHSVMTSRGEVGEFDVVKELLDKNPSGILSIVIDSYNFERFIKVCGTRFKEQILNREGRIVFRPASGDIIKTSQKCLELLGKYFGCCINSKGYKVLPDKVRVLWGDGIDKTGIELILLESAKNDWSSENWVFGMGGGLLQKVNRDNCRFAFKCSSQKYNNEWHDVQKVPLDKTKASKAGRLSLIKNALGNYETVKENDKQTDYLETVFENGYLIREQSFIEIRDLVRQ